MKPMIQVNFYQFYLLGNLRSNSSIKYWMLHILAAVKERDRGGLLRVGVERGGAAAGPASVLHEVCRDQRLRERAKGAGHRFEWPVTAQCNADARLKRWWATNKTENGYGAGLERGEQWQGEYECACDLWEQAAGDWHCIVKFDQVNNWIFSIFRQLRVLNK